MISGIKRKTTAIESAFRYFQTIDLIVNHFKRDADREKIFELVQPESTLKDLLIATAAIHLYHNVGIRVGENLEFHQFSQDSAKKFELSEKSILTNELSELLMDSISSEINLLKRLTSLENKILNYLIEERRLNIKEPHRKEKISDIENQIEQNLLEVILNFPPFYFYDLLGDLIGYANDIKMKILEESSAFKDLSIEIEKKIKIEEKEDKVIEISTLNKLINKIQKDFEFKSYKELQMQNMSIRMIKRKVIDYNFNRYPISIQGLNMFREANNLKIDLIEKIDSALSKSINYEDFEKNMLSYIKSEIIKKMKSSPNDFIYFLESINECSFNEIMYILNKYGIHNILNLIRMDEDLALKVKRNMIRYNIDKYNIINLNSNTKNLILLAKKALCDLEILPLKKKIINYENLSESNLLEFINLNDEDVEHFWKKFQQNSGIKLNELKDFIRKKEIIDKVFIQDLKLNNYSQILLLLNFEDIISNLAKDIFYYLFSKILRQISRIIESYLKITNDKTLILLALRKIDGTTDSEDWVRIKLEELIINRIKKRQKELVIIFNANDQPYLVNGFIFSRLTDLSLKEGISVLKNEISSIYKEIKSLKLKEDLISPISYCIAYDLIKRYQEFEQNRKIKVESILEKKEVKKEEKKKEIREKQETSTLNWIERRITSSLMRINSPGINPNQLYWQEKDTKTATDNIKLHSELKGKDITDLFVEYFLFAIEKIQSQSKIPVPKINEVISDITEIIEKELKKRLAHSASKEERNYMLEGERYQIAKQLAVKIGKLLDKALYDKFKNRN